MKTCSKFHTQPHQKSKQKTRDTSFKTLISSAVKRLTDVH